MISIFPAIVHRENGFWIEFPDLPGCQTYGDSLEETMSEASEALGLYLVSLLEDGKKLPKASDLKEIDSCDGIGTYITTNVDDYRRNTKAVKKMVSLPAWLAELAEDRNISLSKTLQDALKVMLETA